MRNLPSDIPDICPDSPDSETPQPTTQVTAQSSELSHRMNRRKLLKNMTIAAGVTSASGLAAATHLSNVPRANAQDNTHMPAVRTAASGPSSPFGSIEPTPEIGVIVMNRMAFGPRPGDLQAFLALGSTPEERLQIYVDQQLNPESIDDNVCDLILANQGFKTLDLTTDETWTAYIHREGDANKNNDRYLPAKEVRRAAFLRAIYSEKQLVEVLADFWHNHFNVYAWSYWEGPTFRLYDRDAIRANMLGNFRKMLEDVARSTAMLYYLDNQSNSGGDPNENYARELFELHTMGAENYLGVISTADPSNNERIYDEDGNPTGYVDDWVYGATTCFSGWQVNDETGHFEFNESAHFPYQKFVLGKILPPNQGIKDGQDVLDMLVTHPGTARYIARKLCRRFIADDPPERIVQEAADVFLANLNAPDQLKLVVRTVLLSAEFKTIWGEKMKRPFEYAVSAMRGTRYDFEPRDEFFWRYNPAGQPLFGWPAPDGFPDEIKNWTSTMSYLQRMRLANYLMDWKFPNDGAQADQYRFRPEEQTPSSLKTPQALVDFWVNRILGRSLPTHQYEPIVEFMAFGRSWTQDLPAEDIQERLRYMIALILMSPVFMLR